MENKVAKIENKMDVALSNIEQVPIILTKSKQALVSASQAVSRLPDIESEESKVETFSLRDRIKNAKETYKELRMPFTRALDAIKKEFTSNEKGFDELIEKLEGSANAYAKKVLAKQRAEEERLEREKNKKLEEIRLKNRIKTTLEGRVDVYLDQVRAHAGDIVKKATKKTLKEAKDKLSVDPKWRDTLTKDISTPEPWVKDDVSLWDEAIDAHLDDLIDVYEKEAKDILIASVGILEVAVNNKEEAARIAKADEEERLKAKKKAEEEANARLEAEVALADLDSEKEVETTNMVVDYKINISDNVGWLKLIAFWFEHDPDSKTKDLSRKTFAQCKRFAEKMAKSDSLFVEHESIEYEEKVKAKK